MEYVELKNCILESTNILCPACGSTLLQKIVPKGTVLIKDFIYYFICPNPNCGFLGSPQVSQVETTYKCFSNLGIKYVDFSSSIIAGFDPLVVSFKANCIGMSIDSYMWTFGDGATHISGVPDISHTYMTPGTYTVTLTVHDNVDNVTLSHTKTNLINVSTFILPTANFSMSKTTGDNTLEVNFSDLSTGSNIVAWHWDFGDGNFSSEQNPTHKYTYPGIYSVELTVTNSKNQKDTLLKPNVINVNLTKPVAKFIQTEVAGYVPLTVLFSYAGADEYFPTYFKWTFGDGATSTEQNPVHTYTTAGIYDVQLEVGNSKGKDAVLKLNAVVAEAPKIIIGP